MNDNPKSEHESAAMDPEKRRAIAPTGGQSVPAENHSFSKDRSLAAILKVENFKDSQIKKMIERSRLRRRWSPEDRRFFPTFGGTSFSRKGVPWL